MVIMTHNFYFYQLMLVGKQLKTFEVDLKKKSACRETVTIIADYICESCGNEEKWKFVFYVLTMPSHNNKKDSRIVSFERFRIDSK